MSPELTALVAPLDLDRGIHVVPVEANAPMTDHVKASYPAILLGLAAKGRDAAALVVVSHAVGQTVVVCDSRGAIRDMLRGLGAIAETLSRRLATRAPERTWFVVALDDQGRGSCSLAALPGCELDEGPQA
jgi:hypothetical protein